MGRDFTVQDICARYPSCDWQLHVHRVKRVDGNVLNSYSSSAFKLLALARILVQPTYMSRHLYQSKLYSFA